MNATRKVTKNKKGALRAKELMLPFELIAEIQKKEEVKVTKKPVDGRWFKVDIENINQDLFLEERKDRKQEWTRKIILEAIEEADKMPERYKRTFYTMMPTKNWGSRTIADLEEIASEIGDHMANWIEQSLEWAQRLSNGESWESICNKADRANWYRIVTWKGGHARRIGGSRECHNSRPATDVAYDGLNSLYSLNCTVPLVICYEI